VTGSRGFGTRGVHLNMTGLSISVWVKTFSFSGVIRVGAHNQLPWGFNCKRFAHFVAHRHLIDIEELGTKHIVAFLEVVTS
jgi:hypothetical protein